MDRGRAARGGQKPTTPTTRLMSRYSRINACYATRLGLLSMRERAEILDGDLCVDLGPGSAPRWS